MAVTVKVAVFCVELIPVYTVLEPRRQPSLCLNSYVALIDVSL
jgi:hypothetical protein